MAIEFPNLQPGQYAVIHAEVATGIVLNLDNTWRLGSGEAWLVFDSLEEARIYASRKVLAYPEVECDIYNHLEERVERLWNEAYWKSKRPDTASPHPGQ